MEARKASGIVTTTYQRKKGFRTDRFNPVVIAETERVRFLEICFEPGQFIPAHKPRVDLALFVVEGEGELVAGERREKLAPGSIAFIPAGEARAIRASTRMILLNYVTPPPTGGDHEGVEEKIKRGIWP